jgi:hypothetical protein
MKNGIIIIIIILVPCFLVPTYASTKFFQLKTKNYKSKPLL